MIDGEPVVEVFSFNGDLSALIVDQVGIEFNLLMFRFGIIAKHIFKTCIKL